MSVENTFHLSTAAAEKYESQKVPSVFEPLAKEMLDSISVPENAKVVDLAFGAGIIPKLLTTRLPGKGRIVGIDLNSAMIEIARSTMPPSVHAGDIGNTSSRKGI